jgi:hypothetical protein
MADTTTPGAGSLNQGTGADGTPGGTGDVGEVAKLRADNTRLRQEVAKNESLNTRALPLVRLGKALLEAEGGQEIVDKLNKGEPLTSKEEKTVQQAQDKVDPNVTPLSKGEATEMFKGLLEEAVEKMGQTVAAERKAADNLAELEARGEKELEGFVHLKKDPQYQRQVNDIIDQIRDGTIEVPKEHDNVWWFAMDTAHKVIHALRGTPVKVTKGEKERVAEVIAAGGAGPSSSNTPSKESDIPEGMEDVIGKIRGYGNRNDCRRQFRQSEDE